MLVNLLPEKSGKVLTDNGSTTALTTGQKAALIDGVENSGGITFGSSGYGSNILTGGTATASDYYSATYAPAKAADGSTGTWWETQTLNPPHWWKYQLAAAKTVTKLTIQCGHIYGLKNFTLDGSNDNTNWTTVYTGQAAQVTTQQVFTFTNTTAYLYYRINGSDIWVATNSFRIQEFQMFETVLGSLNFKLDITGSGNAPVNEVRYFTTETDTTKVTIKTSTDNTSWTTRTTAAGGSGYLKAAVGAAVRYVTIDHPSSVSQTSYEIEVFTQRCPRPLGMAFHVRNHSSRFALSTFTVRNYSARKAGAAFSVRQHSSRFAEGSFNIRKAVSRRAAAAFDVRQVAARRVAATFGVYQRSSRFEGVVYSVIASFKIKVGCSFDVRNVSMRRAGVAFNVRAISSRFAGAAFDVRQLAARRAAASFDVRNISARFAEATFSICQKSSRFVEGSFNIREALFRFSGAAWSIRQHSSRFAAGNYRIRQVAPVYASSAYHIFPPVPAWFDEGGASLESIITGLLKTGAVSAVVPLRLWNAHGGEIALKMVNVKITVALDNGGYNGGTYPQGQEIVDGKWVELKSSGIVGSGIIDDSQSAFSPVGGPPASGALSIGDIPQNSARIIFLRLNLPASPLTLFAATPRLLISYDVLE